MSKFLTNAAVTEFESLVKQVYQAQGFRLKDKVRAKTGVVGEKISFPVFGAGICIELS